MAIPYREPVSEPRDEPGYPAPVREFLRPYLGRWVAVKGDEVVASAPTSYELARILIDEGIDGPGVCTEYVFDGEMTFGALGGVFEEGR